MRCLENTICKINLPFHYYLVERLTIECGAYHTYHLGNQCKMPNGSMLSVTQTQIFIVLVMHCVQVPSDFQTSANSVSELCFSNL